MDLKVRSSPVRKIVMTRRWCNRADQSINDPASSFNSMTYPRVHASRWSFAKRIHRNRKDSRGLWTCDRPRKVQARSVRQNMQTIYDSHEIPEHVITRAALVRWSSDEMSARSALKIQRSSRVGRATVPEFRSLSSWTGSQTREAKQVREETLVETFNDSKTKRNISRFATCYMEKRMFAHGAQVSSEKA